MEFVFINRLMKKSLSFTILMGKKEEKKNSFFHLIKTKKENRKWQKNAIFFLIQ